MATSLFAGASRYSQDFSAVIERQVSIASLRLTQMQQERTRSSDVITALKLVSARVTALQTTLQAIGDSTGTKSWQASSSEPTLVSATAADGAPEGSYTLRVVSLGAYANSISSGGVSDPASGDFVPAGTTTLSLSVTNPDSGVTDADKPVTISGTTLQDVVDGINSTAGLNVKAAIVNVGTSSTPSYALSLQSTKYGKFALQLKNGATDLMSIPGDTSDPSLGSQVEYKINGATVKSDSRSVILAPKLTADLLKADSTKDVTISVAQNRNAFPAAISTFIATYNSVLDEMDKHIGQGGPLAGNSIVFNLQRQMASAITSVTGSGSLSSMANIGLEFTKTGRLSFNASLFNSETAGKFSDLQALIGTADTSGFMKVATDALKGISDTQGNGILAGTITALSESLVQEDSRIESEQKRVEDFTKDLQERLAKADALIAALEQQANYFTNMFEAMRTNQKSMS